MINIAVLSYRGICDHLYVMDVFQIAVVCMVILDAVFVLCELLLDLSIIKADHGKIAPQVTHKWCMLSSISLCTSLRSNEEISKLLLTILLKRQLTQFQWWEEKGLV